jgi:hypothetical protein
LLQVLRTGWLSDEKERLCFPDDVLTFCKEVPKCIEILLLLRIRANISSSEHAPHFRHESCALQDKEATCPPGAAASSTIIELKPKEANSEAQYMPAKPDPTITTSRIIVIEAF